MGYLLYLRYYFISADMPEFLYLFENFS